MCSCFSNFFGYLSKKFCKQNERPISLLTMDSIESNIKNLLNGELIDDQISEICDYTLGQQIKELAAKGVESSLSPEFKPILRQTVAYIAAAVLFNEKNEVLMIQEAHMKYAGQWYLPAGRVDPDEQIIDAVKREVEEETGLLFEPTTLLMVESSAGNWFRFTFTGNIVGGELKTVAKADKESLQASWVSDINQLDLRGTDCIRLIDFVKKYLQKKDEFHKPVFPVIKAHERMLMRLVCAVKRKDNNRLHVLVSEDPTPHLPVCEINPGRSFHAALKRFMGHIFDSNGIPEHRPHGLLSVEHNGIPTHEHDGICLTILVGCKVPLEESVPTSGYTWLQIDPELETILMSKFPKQKTLNLSVI